MIKVFIIILFLFFNSCSTFKKEIVQCPNLIAPKKPKNKATRLESSITRPFAKPFKNPKPSRRPIIKSTKFTLLNYFIFRNVGI